MPFFVNEPHLRDREIGNGKSNIKQKPFNTVSLHIHRVKYTHTRVRHHFTAYSKHTWDEMHATVKTHIEIIHMK